MPKLTANSTKVFELETLESTGPNRTCYLSNGSYEDDLVSPDKLGALLAEALIGVIVGVGDLPIGDPNDSISTAPKREGVTECGTIDPIPDIPEGPPLCPTSPIGE